ncbi:four helix bundle protein [Candidatus Nomurabacteria bacterium RIFCSPHIGHO2_02_FULL_33_12]|uniref:Four helix bundle protein n=1 Tax=Candidatus Nomurabacteria bacterium RIFCSPLOWO2_01_FULL_33_17 TaxID=1801764 RepID=A0A1F6WN10_9BACT|nr:MAG: four helix bundle protein [Candidatus Nomurabacteria bacterium RIFCSPHIGHO2_02_FULL_33_12]OGI83267.1 MAG: four helix bundle protein [Candidatus Nomurabacteria bacterium RIFCSPLOWO2_01_FULL_33_17]
MIIKSFEDIMVWSKAKEFVVLVYKHFSNIKDYSFRDQIQRASVSIMNNIAEGFERQTNKELRNFLFIAKGSCGEVRSMLSLAVDLNYISLKEKEILSERSIEISKMLSGFIKTL